MNYKIAIILIVFFIFSTIVVYFSDTSQNKPVIITTQSMQIRYTGSDNIKVSNASSINTKNTIKVTNKTVNVNKTKVNANLSDNIKNIEFDSKPLAIENNNVFSDTDIKYENRKPEKIAHKPPEDMKQEYKNLNWNEWRSDFLNRILDDTDTIESLNEYPTGTSISFSFNVTNTGEIKDINIFAPQLKQDDRLAFRMLLMKYAKQDITVFPQSSERKQVNVRSILILDNSERRARPEDFFDGERVKI